MASHKGYSSASMLMTYGLVNISQPTNFKSKSELHYNQQSVGHPVLWSSTFWDPKVRILKLSFVVLSISGALSLSHKRPHLSHFASHSSLLYGLSKHPIQETYPIIPLWLTDVLTSLLPSNGLGFVDMGMYFSCYGNESTGHCLVMGYFSGSAIPLFMSHVTLHFLATLNTIHTYT
jgi:hypothetical protein